MPVVMLPVVMLPALEPRHLTRQAAQSTRFCAPGKPDMMQVSSASS